MVKTISTYIVPAPNTPLTCEMHDLSERILRQSATLTTLSGRAVTVKSVAMNEDGRHLDVKFGFANEE